MISTLRRMESENWFVCRMRIDLICRCMSMGVHLLWEDVGFWVLTDYALSFEDVRPRTRDETLA